VVAGVLHPQTQVIVDQEYLPALSKRIEKADTSIDILSFSFAIGSAAGSLNVKGAVYAIAKKLAEIKERQPSVRRRLFIEGLRETAERNQITGEFLERAGVEVRYGSTHAKGFCFDERYVLFGSTNLSNQSIMKNHEANLLIDDREVAQGFMQYFDHLWNGGKHGELELQEPWLADGAFEPALIDLCDRATRTLDFAIYFFNHREIEKAIVRAHKRGVRVRGFVHQHKSFAYPYVARNRATVGRMRAAGLRDLHLGIPTTFSHSKYIVADDKELMLGTGNWLLEDVHIHPQLYIHLENASVSKALLEHLAMQIQEAKTDGAQAVG
jgi:phosphatidylserine/phosphatidylglycerophosphate/cardiolipin synthase-like enzyme